MAKPGDEDDASQGRRRRKQASSAASGQTRAAILRAAAELIAELGWGGVTTRAIAERAGVPHGAVNYHFKGKEEVLREAAFVAVQQAFELPLQVMSEANSVAQLLEMTTPLYGTASLDETAQAVALEALRQAARDPWLNEHLNADLRRYRGRLAQLVRADQDRGPIDASVDADGLAAAIAAAQDGLLLHAMIDPTFDVERALTALARACGLTSKEGFDD